MKISGIVTAMVTPLNEHGIDEYATRVLVNRLLDSGVSGLFILGTNGEFYALSEAEKLMLAEIVVNEVDGRVPVFAGSGGISTEATIDLTNKLKKVGVTAVSIITPFLIKLNENELTHHYETIVKNTDLPIILYNIPANTAINISEEVFKRLIKNEKIVGIKDSSGDIENIKMYIRNSQERKDFSVQVGSDSKILSGLLLGADGAIAATSNILTKTDVGIYHQFLKGNIQKARELQESIEEFRRILKLATVPSVLKYCCAVIGNSVGDPKLPVIRINKDHHEEIMDVLSGYQKIEGFDIENEKK